MIEQFEYNMISIILQCKKYKLLRKLGKGVFGDEVGAHTIYSPYAPLDPPFSHLLCALGGNLYKLHPLGTGAFWLPDGFSQWEDMRG